MLFSVAEKVSFKRDYNASATHDFILIPASQDHNVFRSSLWNLIIKSSTSKAKLLIFTFQSVKRNQ